MNVGSLFSGIGGIELGFERAGFHTAWFIERDLYAKTILKKHFLSAKIYDDVRCLGNAVVPQCAEVFARAIKEGEGVA